eukprot:TRINITY_DN14909_c0_g4_i2.p1 TRINITY_DN14909_c0_g4~~TRINITY_DN14909_c0_g4_i2.p1  ORF type:complete len:971 (+),score=232.66 TRINITY_DN14909_c0_g4_i2:84-2915(+)
MTFAPPRGRAQTPPRRNSQQRQPAPAAAAQPAAAAELSPRQPGGGAAPPAASTAPAAAGRRESLPRRVSGPQRPPLQPRRTSSSSPHVNDVAAAAGSPGDGSNAHRARIPLLPSENGARGDAAGGARQGAPQRAGDRLRAALNAGRAATALAHPRGSARNQLREWTVVAEEGAPVCDCPNGSLITTAPVRAMAVQVGPIVADSFGAEWIPLRMPSGATDKVGFSPVVVHRFTADTEETLECWQRCFATVGGEVVGDVLEKEKVVRDIRCTSPVPPSIELSKYLASLPSQGFLHGFQFRANTECTEEITKDPMSVDSFVPRRGSVHPVDWNASWQKLMETPVDFEDACAVAKWQSDVDALYNSFCETASDAVQVIVDEMTSTTKPTGDEKRQVTPVGGVAGEHLYMEKGILFQLASDAIGGGRIYSLAAARRAAALEVRHTALLHATRVPLISAPLTCCITYLGYRMQCTALLPIRVGTMAFGSTDGGRTLVTKSRGGPLPLCYKEALAGVAQGLGLRPHRVGAHEDVVPLAADTQVHAGDDGRVYATALSRLMPPALPAAPKPTRTAASERIAVLTKLLRPEAVQGVDCGVSSDAFSDLSGGSQEQLAAQAHMAALASQWVRTQGVEAVAEALGCVELPEGMEAPKAAPGAICLSCSQPFGNHMRFAALLDCSRHLCRDCYLLLWRDALDGGVRFELADEKLASIARGCGSAPRKLRGMVMVPNVVEIMHFCGVNMRHLGAVYCALRADCAVATQHYLQCEMIARAAKPLIWSRHVKASTAGGVGAVRRSTGQVLKALLQPDGELAENFWAKELGPTLTSKYCLHIPFSTANLDTLLVCERVCALTGIGLPQSSFETLLQEGRVVTDSLTCHPVVKGLQVKPSPLPPGVLAQAVSSNEPALREFWQAQLGGVRTRRPAPHWLAGLLPPWGAEAGAAAAAACSP